MKKFVIVALVIGVIALAMKKRSSDRSEWQGLTETEARERLNDRFPARMPEDKRDFVADKIVSKMRDKGVIVVDGEVDLTDTVDLSDDTEVEGHVPEGV